MKENFVPIKKIPNNEEKQEMTSLETLDLTKIIWQVRTTTIEWDEHHEFIKSRHTEVVDAKKISDFEITENTEARCWIPMEIGGLPYYLSGVIVGTWPESSIGFMSIKFYFRIFPVTSNAHRNEESDTHEFFESNDHFVPSALLECSFRMRTKEEEVLHSGESLIAHILNESENNHVDLFAHTNIFKVSNAGLPPKTGIKLYSKILSLMQYVASCWNKEIIHLVSKEPAGVSGFADHKDDIPKIASESWDQIFLPLLLQNGYRTIDATHLFKRYSK